jgi:hypothetical protein
MGGGDAVFVRDGRMREREAQPAFVAELVAETLLEFGEGGHESMEKHRTFNIQRRTSKVSPTRALGVRR